MQINGNTIIALDVGERRTGVAIAHKVSRLPRPLCTLEQGPTITQEIQQLVKQEDVGLIVVGLPRNLEGNDTLQTQRIQSFVDGLRTVVEVPIQLQDEAVTSVQAESELKQRGKPYAKEDIDALAATYILDDFLKTAVVKEVI